MEAKEREEWDYDPDAHSCSAEADELGYCQVCGAIVRGSYADYTEHGYDPPDLTEDEYRRLKYSGEDWEFRGDDLKGAKYDV